MPGANAQQVSARRRKVKQILAEEAGGICVDCGGKFPPFVFDFDHRDPSAKSFMVSSKGSSISIARLREEAAKCDLVCANCHRMRTHKQRCTGCDHCASHLTRSSVVVASGC